MAAAGDTAEVGRRPARLAGLLLIGANLVDVLAAYPDTTVDRFVVVTGSAIHLVDITGWLWLDLIVGMAAVLAGVAVVANRRWAQPLAIAGAVLAIAVDILIFPYGPIRAAMVVSLNAAAVGLLVKDRRSRRPG